MKLRGTIVLVGIIVVMASWVLIGNSWLQVEQLTVPMKNLPPAFEGFRIVHISDLHLPKNAVDLERLIAAVRAQAPDVIAITGDLVDNSADLETCGLRGLLESLTAIADVYAVTGNHERWYPDRPGFEAILEEYHVKLIDNDYVILKRDGGQLALMGLSDETPYSMDVFDHIEAVRDMPRALLAHRPELWPTYASDSHEVRPDLVLSGHAHGGQVRIPFVGGLVAPDQGWLPAYTSGLYVAENGTQMIVSRGLGHSIIPLRVNNRPHLPVVTLIAPPIG